LTFIIPVLTLELSSAIFVAIVWGLTLISIFSIYLAEQQKVRTYKVVLEHLIIAILVILATHVLGDFIGTTFGS